MHTYYTNFMGNFPQRRMRRNRRSPWVRSLVQESSLSTSNLIWPIFIAEGKQADQDIPSMPGVRRISIKNSVKAAEQAAELGIPCIALFPFIDPQLKNETGSEALNPNNLVCRAIRAIKSAVPEIGVMADVALDPYTSHGHDGILEKGSVLNDETVAILCEQALQQALAGADIVAPSDMMDGRVGAIRRRLDTQGLQEVLIMSYAVKYASAFYAPFRDAIGSGGCLRGDKRNYQMHPANTYEALHEVALDLQEGADMILIKPGTFYLDICARVKENFHVPTFAYQTSGEYIMIRTLGEQPCIDPDQAMMESLLAFRRAGCDGILTYWAPQAAKILLENKRS